MGPNIYYGEQVGDDLLARCVRLNNGQHGAEARRRRGFASEVELLPPWRRADRLHRTQLPGACGKSAGEVPAEDAAFLNPPSCLLPHGGTIVLPAGSSRVDRGEIALVMCQRCKDCRAKRPTTMLLGVTAFNVSALRDWQSADGHGRAPGCDTFGPCGPWIDTIAAEALRSARRCKARFSANGQHQRRRGETAALTVTTTSTASIAQHGAIVSCLRLRLFD